MPTAKRERKKAGKAARRAQIEAARKRAARRRQAVILLVIAAIAVGVLFLVNHGSKKTKVKTAAVKPTCPPANGSTHRQTQFTGPPPMCINPADNYSANVVTDVGSFTIKLDSKSAPESVNNFVFLSRWHYYDGVVFHRVIPGFVVQGGDPTGTGSGGPGYTIPDEYPKAGAYKLGSVAMANTGSPHSGGSQFYIVTGAKGESLPPKYSLFGQVASGMDVVQKIDSDGSASGVPPKVTHHIVSVTVSPA